MNARVLKASDTSSVAGLDWGDASAVDPQARREAELQDAYHRGHADGRSAAEQDGAAALPRVIGAIADAAAELDRAVGRRTRADIETVVELALDVARWVLVREATIDPSILIGRLEQALEQVNPTGRLIVHTAPGAARAIASWGGTVDAEIREDAALLPGEARLEGGHAGADLTYDEALRRAREALESLPLEDVATPATPPDAEGT